MSRLAYLGDCNAAECWAGMKVVITNEGIRVVEDMIRQKLEGRVADTSVTQLLMAATPIWEELEWMRFRFVRSVFVLAGEEAMEGVDYALAEETSNLGSHYSPVMDYLKFLNVISDEMAQLVVTRPGAEWLGEVLTELGATSPDDSISRGEYLGLLRKSQSDIHAGSEFSSNDDYSYVTIRGTSFDLPPRASRIIRRLHLAYLGGSPNVDTAHLLELLGGNYSRLSDGFKPNHSAAFRELVKCNHNGTYRMNLRLKS